MILGTNFSSCRSCKGGGWYGDRNLGYTPAKDNSKAQKDLVTKPEEESCDITAP